jgi:glycosyltransferase involved in cell wall biosynthesis
MSPRRLRLLYLMVWHPFPPGTGSQIRSASLCEALAEHHDLDILAFRQGPPGEPPVPPPFKIGRWHVVDRAPFERRPLRLALGWLSPRPRHIFAMETREMRAQAMLWCRDAQYDAIIASTTALADLALELPAGAHVLEEHNFMGRMMADRLTASRSELGRFRSRLRLWKNLRWERGLFERFDRVTLVSGQDRASALGFGFSAERLAVVPNGVDVAACQAVNVQPEPSSLIYPGSMTYAPNRDAVTWFVDRVWPALRQSHPDLTLRVTGSTAGVDLGDMDRLPGLSFTGHVEAVWPLVKASRICIVPLQEGGGTRLKVLEAMALGTPVVATAKAVEGLEVESEQHLLLADDGPDFVRQVDRLLRDDALAARLAARALAHVAEHYDWKTIGPRFVEVVEAACRKD